VKRVLAIIALLSLGALMTAGCGKKDPTENAAPPTGGNGAPQEPGGGNKPAVGDNNTSGMQKPAVNPGG
jgi:hypothetical protein